jgi:transposase-like protein
VSHLSDPQFHDEAAAFAEIEAILWPSCPVCPRCQERERITRVNGKTARPGLRRCLPCKRQFTVTVGTVFQSSHIPMHKWLQAVYLLSSSKKGMSSHQLMRTLEVTYKTAWFMTHRIREAMATGTFSPIGGAGKIVEVDETFIGNKKGVPIRRGYAHKRAVLTLVERGGSAKSFHVDGTSAKDLIPILKTHIKPETRVMTDEAGQYAHLGKSFAQHEFVTHGRRICSRRCPYEYAKRLLFRV